jgi:putative heme-binding domain-containing protein
MWGLLAPVVRTGALADLLARAGRVPLVLDAIQTGKIPASDLSSAQRNYLRTYPIPALRLRALQLLGPIPVSRPDIIQTFKPALTLRGIPDRGRAIFRQRCLQCHRQADDPAGPGVGPDLLRARTLSREQLLARIIQPNVGVRPDYSTRILDSKEGESLIGIMSDENRLTITMTQLDGTKVVWPQLNINSIRLQSWSLMPEGLEIGMSPQDISDLMEFVGRGAK